MRKIIFLAFISIASFQFTQAQKAKLDQNSIVKDTSGNIIPYPFWNQLMTTGRYKLRSDKKENPEFVISRIPDEEFDKKFENTPKPKESRYFRTGNRFNHFKTTDINGNKINTKNLDGKIVVLNYWFIKCPPCVREIPELNHLVEKFKGDTSVVFIGIALDEKYELEQFFKDTKFDYTIVDNGRFIAAQNGINSYPTNVVIDQQGKVYFHSSGLSYNTAYWIKKSIEELRGKQENKIASVKTDN